MTAIRTLIFLGLAAVTHAAEVEVVVLASVATERLSASGLQVEFKKDMPDFAMTYLRGPASGDSIGIYEGGHPSLFSERGKRLGEVKDVIAGQPVVWVFWSEEKEGKKLFGAEALLRGRRIIFGGAKSEAVEQIHVFVFRTELKDLAAARKLAGSLIKTEPNQSPQPTAPSGRG